MNCPVCSGVSLQMTERQGVEIDYCPKCRGVWLDRGELDKLIERATGDEGPEREARGGPAGARPGPQPVAPPMYPPPAQHGYAPPTHPGHAHPGHAHPPGYNPNADSKYGYPYKKKSMWREMFDF